MMQAGKTPRKRKSWRQKLVLIGGTIAYMVPLFWLWGKAHFPDSFGIVIDAHGRAGLLEEWWYSYLLLNRPNAIDLVTFAYMWLPVAGLIGWVIYKQLSTKPISFSIFADRPGGHGDPPQI
ncbi:hypothetical protein GRI58_14915 [Porphyrobacter algicida]|uniref:Uncharacterized protein n=1 Tax=Qipengyuania algicida TaxID=1836209 RepID=A0A845ATB4_9SPHN|nr:hypothetical protein [Qipengyuania algicida]MXP30098.1 hypothetical protein [Qipengyuania algicida]